MDCDCTMFFFVLILHIISSWDKPEEKLQKSENKENKKKLTVGFVINIK